MSEQTLLEQVTAAYEASVEEPSQVDESSNDVEEKVEAVAKESPQEDAKAVIADDESSQEEELRAPDNWSQNDKETFNALESKGREFVLRRYKETEAAFTRKSQAHAEEVKIAQQFREVIEPRSEYLRQIGIQPMEAVAYLIDTEKKLRLGTHQEKQEAFQNLAKIYGLPTNQQVMEEQPLDPALQTVFDTLSQHEQHLAQLNQEREHLQKEREYVKHQKMVNTINTFADAKDANGNLKHPHFDLLKEKMGALIRGGEVDSLDEAYTQAAEKYLKKDEILRYYGIDKREEDSRKKTISSKNATFNVKSASSSDDPAVKTKKLSPREAVLQAFEMHTEKEHRI